jgi:hypothetical protein
MHEIADLRSHTHKLQLNRVAPQVLMLLIIDSLAMIGLAVMNFMYVTNVPGGFYNSSIGLMVEFWLIFFFESIISTSQVLVFFPLPAPSSSPSTHVPSTQGACPVISFFAFFSNLLDMQGYATDTSLWKAGAGAEAVQAGINSVEHAGSLFAFLSYSLAFCSPVFFVGCSLAVGPLCPTFC